MPFNLCRICLLEKDSKTAEMQPLFESNSKCQEIVRKIELCGGIVLKPHEEFPKMICKKCMELLKISCKFRNMCQQSEHTLLEVVVKSEPADSNSQESEIFFDMHTEFIDADSYAEEVDLVQIADTGDVPDVTVEYDSNNEDEADDDDDKQHIDAIEISGEVHEEYNESDIIESDAESSIEDKKPLIRLLNTKRNSSLASANKRKVGRPRLSSIDKKKIMKKPGFGMGRGRKKIEEEPASIMCEICGNIYSKRSLLNMHMRRHLSNKPFDCEICGKAFACPSEIGRHMRVHTGEKPYSCKFCGRTFADRSTNIKHERIHTNERPFTCQTCGKSFTYSNVLKNHMLTHTGEKPFSCEPCNKTFSRKHQLDQHCSTITHQQTVKNIEFKLEKELQEVVVEQQSPPQSLHAAQLAHLTEGRAVTITSQH